MYEKILVIEDEGKIRRFIRANLQVSNYTVITACDGEEGLNLYEQHLPDLILLDLMLPTVDGFSLLSKIRDYSSVPIIIITAKGSSTDVIKGLELGADDYVIKPFDVNELLARIRAVLRRSSKDTTAGEPLKRIGSLELNFLSQQVAVQGRPVSLTATEFKLLAELANNVGCVLTHEHLLKKIWGFDYINETHYLRVCVSRIRRKTAIEAGMPGYIKNVPTVGYLMLGKK